MSSERVSCKRKNSQQKISVVASHGTGCSRELRARGSIGKCRAFSNARGSIVSTICSPSLFPKLLFYFWPRKVSRRIESSPWPAQAVLHLYGVNLHQIRRRSSVASSRHWSMLLPGTAQQLHFLSCGKRERKMSKIHGVF